MIDQLKYCNKYWKSSRSSIFIYVVVG